MKSRKHNTTEYIYTGKSRRNQNPEQVLNQLHSDKENYRIGKPKRNETAHLPTLSEELSTLQLYRFTAIL